MITEVLKSSETETTVLFEHLDLQFLYQITVFAPDPQVRARNFLHLNCFEDSFTASTTAPTSRKRYLKNSPDDV